MGVLTLVDPVVGTTTDATLIAANDAAIKAVINGGIDASNFGAGLIFNPNKIQQGGALTGQALVWDGAKWAPASAGAATQRKTTAKAVNTTVSATDLLNAEITIAANAVGVNGRIRLTADGDYLNNTGGTVPISRFQLLLGATTLVDTGTTAAGVGFGTNAGRGSWRLVAEIQNLGAANAQEVHVTFTMGGPTFSSAFFAPVTGVGGGYVNGFIALFDGANSGLAIDTTTPKALVLNVINGSASASYETRLNSALVEVL